MSIPPAARQTGRFLFCLAAWSASLGVACAQSSASSNPQAALLYDRVLDAPRMVPATDAPLSDTGVLLGMEETFGGLPILFSTDLTGQSGETSFLLGTTVGTEGPLSASTSLMLSGRAPLYTHGLTPGLWLSGYRPSPLETKSLADVEAMLEQMTFGLALDNRLGYETDRLKVSGFWTMVGSQFRAPNGTDDGGLSKLRGHQTFGYGLALMPIEGLELKHDYSQLQNRLQGHKNFGQVTETTVTGISYARGGTQFSHTVTRNDLAWATRRLRSADATHLTQVSQEFKFLGQAARVAFERLRKEQAANGQRAQETGHNLYSALLPINEDITVSAARKETVQGGNVAAARTDVMVSSKELGGASVGYHVVDLGPRAKRPQVSGFTVGLPQQAVWGERLEFSGEYAHAGPEIPTPKTSERLHAAAAAAPIEGLNVSADYLATGLDREGKVREDTVFDASYAVLPKLFFNLHRTQTQQAERMQSAVTSYSLSRPAAEEGGLSATATYTTARAPGGEPVATKQLRAAYTAPQQYEIAGTIMQSGDQEPSFRAEFSAGPFDGYSFAASYMRQQPRPDEIRAQVVADLGDLKATASYARNYFDGTHGRTSAGETFDVAVDWQVTKDLKMTAGLRTTDTTRAFAGGVGPRLELKGKLSEHDDLALAYVPERSVLVGSDLVAFSTGIEDLPKKASLATERASYLLSYTNIVDADHLFTAYFRGGEKRLDSAEIKPGVDPFGDKQVWVEMRTTF